MKLDAQGHILVRRHRQIVVLDGVGSLELAELAMAD